MDVDLFPKRIGRNTGQKKSSRGSLPRVCTRTKNKRKSFHKLLEKWHVLSSLACGGEWLAMMLIK